MTNNDALKPIQPCEICGKLSPPEEDDKYDDVYFPVRPGSWAANHSYDKERLCGRCACAQFIGSYWNGSPYERGKHTPIEQYLVKGVDGDRLIYVKRDDLWNKARYGGGNAKLRGAEVHLRRLQEQGITHVAVMDARTSRAGWGIAELCRDLGMRCTVHYGRRKDERGTIPYFQQMAAKAGALLEEMPASRVYPMYYKARIISQKQGIYMMPMGLQLSEALLSVAGEASNLPVELLNGTIICVVATGTMFAGLMLGLRSYDTRVIGVYIGMTSGEICGRSKCDPEAIVRNRIKGLLPAGFEPIPFEIKLADREYYDADNYPCPFNCDPYYDRKAWRWLCEHLNELRGSITYWNIG